MGCEPYDKIRKRYIHPLLHSHEFASLVPWPCYALRHVREPGDQANEFTNIIYSLTKMLNSTRNPRANI